MKTYGYFTGGLRAFITVNIVIRSGLGFLLPELLQWAYQALQSVNLPLTQAARPVSLIKAS